MAGPQLKQLTFCQFRICISCVLFFAPFYLLIPTHFCVLLLLRAFSSPIQGFQCVTILLIHIVSFYLLLSFFALYNFHLSHYFSCFKIYKRIIETKELTKNALLTHIFVFSTFWLFCIYPRYICKFFSVQDVML